MKPNNRDKSDADVKWEEILVLWLIVIACFWLLWSCAGNKNEKCKVCDGTGYYEEKTYVFCDGTGESDIKPYKEEYSD